MKISKLLLHRGLCFAVALLAACVFSGCQPAEVEQLPLKPVFFPAAPDEPRLQFLKSFSGPDDLGAQKPSGFERFILGEPETTVTIAKPYGLAIFQGKLYVCDVGKRMVEVLDLKERTFEYLTKDRRLMNPVNIYIDDGIKYVADPTVGAVFVFDENNTLNAILGRELKINPIDIVVRGQRCYVTDFGSNQIVVLDKFTGEEITRIGKEGDRQSRFATITDLSPDQIALISDLAVDQQGNIYVTDKAAGQIIKFDESGRFLQTIGRLGDNIDEFVRPKGIAIDKEDRIWVVDAAPEVVKIYNREAQLLLFFGLPGNRPGMMNLPAAVVIDYDNVELFREYAVEGANIEFLVLVTNQFGLNKINVYGFGSFPEQQRQMTE